MKILSAAPWHRIAAESVAVVFSILLAFAIDAWWADRQIQGDVRESLQAIKTELESNLTLVDRETKYRHAVLASIDKLDTKSAENGQIGSGELDRLLGDLTWVGKSEFSTGALEAALRSEIFSNMEGGDLKRVLAALPALYEYVWEFELADSESTRTQLYPYLVSKASFNQIANTLGSGRPGTGEFAGEQNHRVIEQRDHAALLNSDEFLGLLTTKHWYHADVLDALLRLKIQIEKAVELIDTYDG